MGYERAVVILHPSERADSIFHEGQTTIDTKSAGAIEARIINSGDRGILFFDVKNNQVIFLRWDEVKQITKRPDGCKGNHGSESGNAESKKAPPNET
jgi:hypothetical protein